MLYSSPWESPCNGRGVGKGKILTTLRMLSHSATTTFRACLLVNSAEVEVSDLDVIYQTRRRIVSLEIQTLTSEIKKRAAANLVFFFYLLRSVWISDEPLLRVFDIASQRIYNY